HPVERFYSNYAFDRSFGFQEPMNATLSERPYVLETSRYIDQIKNYLEHYPREQFHFMLLDDLKANPNGEMERLAEFLGIRPFSTMNQEARHANQRGRQHAIRQGNQLLAAVRSTSGGKLLAKLMPPRVRSAGRRLLTHWLPNGPVGRWLSRRHSERIPPLTDEFRSHLHHLLDPSTLELEKFLGRDLSHWRLPATAEL
ncbi:MAG: sulfotransferase domain-containing protein, partial [Aeoliella sp.]